MWKTVFYLINNGLFTFFFMWKYSGYIVDRCGYLSGHLVLLQFVQLQF